MFRRVARNIYLLGLLSFFNDVTSDMITPLLPAFLGTMGLGAAFLGVMEGLASSLSYVTVLLSGWYVDRRGESKRVTVFGYRLCAFVRPLIAVPLPGFVLLARLVDRIGKGIRTAPRDLLITASAEKKSWGEAFGIQRAMDHAGALIGPPVAALLISAYSLNLSALFLIACLPSIAAVLLIPRRIRDVPIRSGGEKIRLSWRALPRPLRRYTIIIFLSALTTPSELFLILKMRELGMEEYQAPLAWFLLTLFTLVAAYGGGLLSDRWSRRGTIGLGWAVYALVFAGFAFNANLAWSWVLMAAYGLHMGLVESAERTYPALIARPEMRATALGWYYFAYGLGLLPASVLFGLLWNFWGSKEAFLLVSGLTLVVTGLLSCLPSDRRGSSS